MLRFFLMILPEQKTFDWIIPEILVIKESCNMIGPEALLATPNKKTWSQILISLDDKLDENKIRYQLFLSRDIDDKRILQSDWIKATTGNTPPKAVFSYATSLSWVSPHKSLTYWLIKSCNILDRMHNLPNPTANGSLWCYLPLVIICMLKI